VKAAYYEAPGAARDVLHVAELPVEEPGAGRVRVRVAASGVNPSDVKTRRGSGARPNAWPQTIPHQDGAGVIDKVGPNVSASRLGERVWLYESQLNRPFGTAAEFVTLPEHLAVPLPDVVSFEEGASLGIPALTAWYCTERVQAAPGKCVLVHGGVGPVGFYAAQMARLRGANVLASVSSDDQAAVAAAAGIATVRRGAGLVEAVNQWLASLGREGVDAMIDLDFAGNFHTNLALAANGAHIASYASDTELQPTIPVRELMRRNLQLSFLLVYSMPAELKQQAIAALTQWLSTKALHHPPVHIYPLQDIVSAHQAVETRLHIGKVLVQP
jgi:NADPH2:quinone reductase